MKKNYSGALFVFLAFLMYENTFAQNLCVYEDEETKHCLSLENVRNLTFSEDVVYLKKTDEAVSDFSINAISKIRIEKESGITNIENILNSGKGIKIFPNPVEDVLTIESADEMVKIHLFDLVGNAIFQKKQKGKQTTIQLTTVPAGIYNLRITTTNGDYIEKIIKK